MGIGRAQVRSIVAVGLLVLTAVFWGFSGSVPAAENPILIRMSVDNPPGSARAKIEESFADLVAKETNNRVKVEIFWSGALGGVQRSAIDTVRAGGAEMALISTANFSALDRTWSLFDLPFLFKGPSGLYKYMDTAEFESLKDETARKDGLHYIFTWYDNWRQLITTKRPVRAPDEIRGLKLRTTGSPIESAYDAAFGAKPVAVDWGETYLALKNGLVDGYFVAYTTVIDYRMNDAVKYGTTLNIVPIPVAFFMNEGFFQKLPPDLRNAIVKAGRQTELAARDVDRQHNLDAMKKLQGEGFAIYTPTAPEMAQWQDRTKPVYAQFGSAFPPDMISKIQSMQ